MGNEVEIPASLQTLEFLEAWKDWCSEQSEQRRRKRQVYTDRAKKMQLKRLAEWGPEESVRAIEHSLCAGWAAIFPAPKLSAKAAEVQKQQEDEERRARARQATLEDYVLRGLSLPTQEEREDLCRIVRDNYDFDAARWVGREIARRLKVAEQKGAKGAKDI